MIDPTAPLLRIAHLTTAFRTEDGAVRAANGISHEVNHGEVVGILSESDVAKGVNPWSLMCSIDSTLLTILSSRNLPISRCQMQIIVHGPFSLLNPRRAFGGCRFHSRYPYPRDSCRATPPLLGDAGSGHPVACHLYPAIPAQAAPAMVGTFSNEAMTLPSTET